MKFKDQVTIVAHSGHGGAGAVHFRREKFIPRGGPDGGNGGRGGDLVFEATTQRNTLIDLRPNKHYRAPSGNKGEGNQRTGRSGEPLILEVPVGTMLHDAETDELLADLNEPGARYVMPGGIGGRGNTQFKSSTHRTPRHAQEGMPGIERRIRCELKLMADVGLLGFPNAGKSTFISTVSAARPKIADYPFTTLVPNLGVVPMGVGESFVIADIPGLIEGAADGAGLGHAFLRHVERCECYLHVVPAEHADGTPAELYTKLMGELQAYGRELLDRTMLVCLSMADLLDEETLATTKAELEAVVGAEVHVISSATTSGVKPLVAALYRVVQEQREARGVSVDDGSSFVDGP